MFALTNIFRRQKAVGVVGDEPSAGGRLVLPRLLRKPARNLSHLLAGNFRLSRRGWSVLALLVLVIGGGVFVNRSEPGHALAARMSAGMGLEIHDIDISGGREVSDLDVISRLDLGQSKSLFTFDVTSARDALSKLSWVKDVRIYKSYPSTLKIELVEKSPFAIWQEENSLFVVERNGAIIDAYEGNYPSLPLLVGKGAAQDGARIVHLVSGLAQLASNVEAYVRVADRRWDLRLDNGINVRLPERKVPEALARLLYLDGQDQLLSREINSVDLRLEDKLVVGLNKTGVAAIKAANEGGAKKKEGKKT